MLVILYKAAYLLEFSEVLTLCVTQIKLQEVIYFLLPKALDEELKLEIEKSVFILEAISSTIQKLLEDKAKILKLRELFKDKIYQCNLTRLRTSWQFNLWNDLLDLLSHTFILSGITS